MKSDFSKNFIKIFAAAAMVIIVALTVAGTVYSENVFQNISGNVVRLHILANSDGENDQNLKLKVRDAVVEYTEPILRDCKSQGEVLSVLADEKENIKSVAENCLKNEGSTYNAYVCVGEYDFPAKNYGKYCFPEGEYQALRVIIGEGEGKNWWCVLFPPLCYISENAVSVSENAEKSLRENLSENAFDTIDGNESDAEEQGSVSDIQGIDDGVKVTYKFKIVELFQKVISLFKD